MAPTHRPHPRQPTLELLASLVWIVGAIGSYFAGATLGVVAGVGVLAATFWVTLLLAWLAIGRRALPRVLLALLLQAPLLVGLGLYALALPLGHAPFPCFFWRGTDLEQLEAFAAVAALSTPLGVLLRLERGSLRRVASFARLAAPAAIAGAAALAILGALRLGRLPTPDRYVASLPLHTTIPSPVGQPCTPIQSKRDPKHDPGWNRDECATPEFEAAPVAFHFHADEPSDAEARYYWLQRRAADGTDVALYLGFSTARAADLPVYRDDALKLFFVQRGDRLAVVAPDRRWSDVTLRDLRHRIAPPLGWWLSTVAGLVFALGCLGASAALGDVAGAGEARRAWIAARRGHLAIAALAVVLCASAPLLAALFAGFLV